ncbi:MAG: hypothetical protein DRG09_04765 [Epsilonproteobacteria bacterium]|nr:MAG: hypothetical protein DRG09_04765 [Campylobacterota bacterium]
MNYNDMRKHIDSKAEERNALLSELDQSVALQGLIPEVFNHPNVRSQWSDKSIAEYGSKRIKPESRRLAKFRVYSGDTLLGTFDYDSVPEALRVFNIKKVY